MTGPVSVSTDLKMRFSRIFPSAQRLRRFLDMGGKADDRMQTLKWRPPAEVSGWKVPIGGNPSHPPRKQLHSVAWGNGHLRSGQQREARHFRFAATILRAPTESHPGKWYGYLGDLFGRVPSRFLPGESRAYLLRDILENVELWENAYPEKL